MATKNNERVNANGGSRSLHAVVSLLQVWEADKKAAEEKLRQYYKSEDYEIALGWQREMYAIEKCINQLKAALEQANVELCDLPKQK